MILKLLALVAVALVGLLALRAWLQRRLPAMKVTAVDRAFAKIGDAGTNAVLVAVALAAGFLVLLHLLDRL